MARAPGRCIYTAMLNERGGFESDLTAQRIGETHYRLYVGTGAVKRDLSWLRRHAEGFQVSLRDRTEDFAVLGLMGPDASSAATALGAPELNELGYFRTGEAELAGHRVRAARLSYVGEAGWEITCPVAAAPAIYRALHEVGARPAGLFAQTAMRIEKRFASYGHELDTDTTPLEAGLGFAVAWQTDFLGREALERRREDGQTSRLVTLVLEDSDAVPLGHEPIWLNGETVGETTSAAFGYRVGRPGRARLRPARVTGRDRGRDRHRPRALQGAAHPGARIRSGRRAPCVRSRAPRPGGRVVAADRYCHIPTGSPKRSRRIVTPSPGVAGGSTPPDSIGASKSPT